MMLNNFNETNAVYGNSNHVDDTSNKEANAVLPQRPSAVPTIEPLRSTKSSSATAHLPPTAPHSWGPYPAHQLDGFLNGCYPTGNPHQSMYAPMEQYKSNSGKYHPSAPPHAHPIQHDYHHYTTQYPGGTLHHPIPVKCNEVCCQHMSDPPRYHPPHLNPPPPSFQFPPHHMQPARYNEYHHHHHHHHAAANGISKQYVYNNNNKKPSKAISSVAAPQPSNSGFSPVHSDLQSLPKYSHHHYHHQMTGNRQKEMKQPAKPVALETTSYPVYPMMNSYWASRGWVPPPPPYHQAVPLAQYKTKQESSGPIHCTPAFQTVDREVALTSNVNEERKGVIMNGPNNNSNNNSGLGSVTKSLNDFSEKTSPYRTDCFDLSTSFINSGYPPIVHNSTNKITINNITTAPLQQSAHPQSGNINLPCPLMGIDKQQVNVGDSGNVPPLDNSQTPHCINVLSSSSPHGSNFLINETNCNPINYSLTNNDIYNNVTTITESIKNYQNSMNSEHLTDLSSTNCPVRGLSKKQPDLDVRQFLVTWNDTDEDSARMSEPPHSNTSNSGQCSNNNNIIDEERDIISTAPKSRTNTSSKNMTWNNSPVQNTHQPLCETNAALAMNPSVRSPAGKSSNYDVASRMFEKKVIDSNESCEVNSPLSIPPKPMVTNEDHEVYIDRYRDSKVSNSSKKSLLHNSSNVCRSVPRMGMHDPCNKSSHFPFYNSFNNYVRDKNNTNMLEDNTYYSAFSEPPSQLGYPTIRQHFTTWEHINNSNNETEHSSHVDRKIVSSISQKDGFEKKSNVNIVEPIIPIPPGNSLGFQNDLHLNNKRHNYGVDNSLNEEPLGNFYTDPHINQVHQRPVGNDGCTYVNLGSNNLIVGDSDNNIQLNSTKNSIPQPYTSDRLYVSCKTGVICENSPNKCIVNSSALRVPQQHQLISENDTPNLVDDQPSSNESRNESVVSADPVYPSTFISVDDEENVCSDKNENITSNRSAAISKVHSTSSKSINNNNATGNSNNNNNATSNSNNSNNNLLVPCNSNLVQPSAHDRLRSDTTMISSPLSIDTHSNNNCGFRNVQRNNDEKKVADSQSFFLHGMPSSGESLLNAYSAARNDSDKTYDKDNTITLHSTAENKSSSLTSHVTVDECSTYVHQYSQIEKSFANNILKTHSGQINDQIVEPEKLHKMNDKTNICNKGLTSTVNDKCERILKDNTRKSNSLNNEKNKSNSSIIKMKLNNRIIKKKLNTAGLKLKKTQNSNKEWMKAPNSKVNNSGNDMNISNNLAKENLNFPITTKENAILSSVATSRESIERIETVLPSSENRNKMTRVLSMPSLDDSPSSIVVHGQVDEIGDEIEGLIAAEKNNSRQSYDCNIDDEDHNLQINSKSNREFGIDNQSSRINKNPQLTDLCQTIIKPQFNSDISYTCSNDSRSDNINKNSKCDIRDDTVNILQEKLVLIENLENCYSTNRLSRSRNEDNLDSNCSKCSDKEPQITIDSTGPNNIDYSKSSLKCSPSGFSEQIENASTCTNKNINFCNSPSIGYFKINNKNNSVESHHCEKNDADEIDYDEERLISSVECTPGSPNVEELFEDINKTRNDYHLEMKDDMIEKPDEIDEFHAKPHCNLINSTCLKLNNGCKISNKESVIKSTLNNVNVDCNGDKNADSNNEFTCDSPCKNNSFTYKKVCYDSSIHSVGDNLNMPCTSLYNENQIARAELASCKFDENVINTSKSNACVNDICDSSAALTQNKNNDTDSITKSRHYFKSDTYPKQNSTSENTSVISECNKEVDTSFDIDSLCDLNSISHCSEPDNTKINDFVTDIGNAQPVVSEDLNTATDLSKEVERANQSNDVLNNNNSTFVINNNPLSTLNNNDHTLKESSTDQKDTANGFKDGAGLNSGVETNESSVNHKNEYIQNNESEELIVQDSRSNSKLLSISNHNKQDFVGSNSSEENTASAVNLTKICVEEFCDSAKSSKTEYKNDICAEDAVSQPNVDIIDNTLDNMCRESITNLKDKKSLESEDTLEICQQEICKTVTTVCPSSSSEETHGLVARMDNDEQNIVNSLKCLNTSKSTDESSLDTDNGNADKDINLTQFMKIDNVNDNCSDIIANNLIRETVIHDDSCKSKIIHKNIISSLPLNIIESISVGTENTVKDIIQTTSFSSQNETNNICAVVSNSSSSSSEDNEIGMKNASKSTDHDTSKIISITKFENWEKPKSHLKTEDILDCTMNKCKDGDKSTTTTNIKRMSSLQDKEFIPPDSDEISKECDYKSDVAETQNSEKPRSLIDRPVNLHNESKLLDDNCIESNLENGNDIVSDKNNCFSLESATSLEKDISHSSSMDNNSLQVIRLDNSIGDNENCVFTNRSIIEEEHNCNEVMELCSHKQTNDTDLQKINELEISDEETRVGSEIDGKEDISEIPSETNVKKNESVDIEEKLLVDDHYHTSDTEGKSRVGLMLDEFGDKMCTNQEVIKDNSEIELTIQDDHEGNLLTLTDVHVTTSKHTDPEFINKEVIKVHNMPDKNYVVEESLNCESNFPVLTKSIKNSDSFIATDEENSLYTGSNSESTKIFSINTNDAVKEDAAGIGKETENTKESNSQNVDFNCIIKNNETDLSSNESSVQDKEKENDISYETTADDCIVHSSIKENENFVLPLPMNLSSSSKSGTNVSRFEDNNIKNMKSSDNVNCEISKNSISGGSKENDAPSESFNCNNTGNESRSCVIKEVTDFNKNIEGSGFEFDGIDYEDQVPQHVISNGGRDNCIKSNVDLDKVLSLNHCLENVINTSIETSLNMKSNESLLPTSNKYSVSRKIMLKYNGRQISKMKTIRYKRKQSKLFLFRKYVLKRNKLCFKSASKKVFLDTIENLKIKREQKLNLYLSTSNEESKFIKNNKKRKINADKNNDTVEREFTTLNPPVAAESNHQIYPSVSNEGNKMSPKTTGSEICTIDTNKMNATVLQESSIENKSTCESSSLEKISPEPPNLEGESEDKNILLCKEYFLEVQSPGNSDDQSIAKHKNELSSNNDLCLEQTKEKILKDALPINSPEMSCKDVTESPLTLNQPENNCKKRAFNSKGLDLKVPLKVRKKHNIEKKENDKNIAKRIIKKMRFNKKYKKNGRITGRYCHKNSSERQKFLVKYKYDRVSKHEIKTEPSNCDLANNHEDNNEELSNISEIKDCDAVHEIKKIEHCVADNNPDSLPHSCASQNECPENVIVGKTTHEINNTTLFDKSLIQTENTDEGNNILISESVDNIETGSSNELNMENRDDKDRSNTNEDSHQFCNLDKNKDNGNVVSNDSIEITEIINYDSLIENDNVIISGDVKVKDNFNSTDEYNENKMPSVINIENSNSIVIIIEELCNSESKFEESDSPTECSTDIRELCDSENKCEETNNEINELNSTMRVVEHTIQTEDEHHDLPEEPKNKGDVSKEDVFEEKEFVPSVLDDFSVAEIEVSTNSIENINCSDCSTDEDFLGYSPHDDCNNSHSLDKSNENAPATHASKSLSCYCVSNFLNKTDGKCECNSEDSINTEPSLDKENSNVVIESSSGSCNLVENTGTTEDVITNENIDQILKLAESDDKRINVISISPNVNVEKDFLLGTNIKFVKPVIKCSLPWDRVFNTAHSKKRKIVRKSRHSSKSGIELGPAKIELRVGINENSNVGTSWKVIGNNSSVNGNICISPVVKVKRLILQRDPDLTSYSEDSAGSSKESLSSSSDEDKDDKTKHNSYSSMSAASFEDSSCSSSSVTNSCSTRSRRNSTCSSSSKCSNVSYSSSRSSDNLSVATVPKVLIKKMKQSEYKSFLKVPYEFNKPIVKLIRCNIIDNLALKNKTSINLLKKTLCTDSAESLDEKTLDTMQQVHSDESTLEQSLITDIHESDHDSQSASCFDSIIHDDSIINCNSNLIDKSIDLNFDETTSLDSSNNKLHSPIPSPSISMFQNCDNILENNKTENSNRDSSFNKSNDDTSTCSKVYDVNVDKLNLSPSASTFSRLKSDSDVNDNNDTVTFDDYIDSNVVEPHQDRGSATKRPFDQSCSGNDSCLARKRSPKSVTKYMFHCQRCLLVFNNKEEVISHQAAMHPSHQELHHCMLCQRSFSSLARHTLHIQSRSHRRLELLQRCTIHAMHRYFTGRDCPRLYPLTPAELKSFDWRPNQPGCIHFYHHPSPLQLALQENPWGMKSIINNEQLSSSTSSTSSRACSPRLLSEKDTSSYQMKSPSPLSTHVSPIHYSCNDNDSSTS